MANGKWQTANALENNLKFALCPLPFEIALSACCLLLTAYWLLGQQSASPDGGQKQDYVIKAQTNVVLVDVRVWDKKGNPVTDLKPEDFKVYEDGVEQHVTSFSVENIAQLAAATADGLGHSVIRAMGEGVAIDDEQRATLTAGAWH